MAQLGTGEGTAIDIERARVDEAANAPADSFGWMTGLNFNPVTGNYQRGPLGGDGEIVDPATVNLPARPDIETTSD